MRVQIGALNCISDERGQHHIYDSTWTGQSTNVLRRTFHSLHSYEVFATPLNFTICPYVCLVSTGRLCFICMGKCPKHDRVRPRRCQLDLFGAGKATPLPNLPWRECILQRRRHSAEVHSFNGTTYSRRIYDVCQPFVGPGVRQASRPILRIRNRHILSTPGQTIRTRRNCHKLFHQWGTSRWHCGRRRRSRHPARGRLLLSLRRHAIIPPLGLKFGRRRS